MNKMMTKNNGQEEIEWLVIDKNDVSIQLLSLYILDYKKYNGMDIDVTWTGCSLRTWLNGTFIKTAFNSDEQKLIRETLVSDDKNPLRKTSAAIQYTHDKVFLLSINEVYSLFDQDGDRTCEATTFAKNQVKNYSTAWWLRTPGSKSNHATCVRASGSINYNVTLTSPSGVRTHFMDGFSGI